MRISLMSLAILFVFSVAVAEVQEKKEEKALGDSLSGIEKNSSTIQIKKNYPNPF